jgi:Na+/melibiose symporter-like transporter
MNKINYELIFILIIIIFFTLFYIIEFKNSIKNVYYLIFYSNLNNSYNKVNDPVFTYNEILSESIKRI